MVLRREGRWQRRPVLAFVLRALVAVVPLGASTAVGLVVGHALGRDDTSAPAWCLAVFGSSLASLLVVHRAARRLLPLVMLLRLSMLFPDRAPRRFRIALRGGSLKKLRAWATAPLPGGDERSRSAETIISLITALRAHDRRTRGHSERVRAFTDLIADELGLREEERFRLRWAALLHDIGKLTVSATVLNKPGKPSDAEWEHIRAHPAEGARIAAPLAAWLGEWYSAIGAHHEQYDGSGYPNGLAGGEIPLAARIVTLTDSFEVMTATRPYGRPMSLRAARRELVACAGAQFDPALVRAFLCISIGRLRRELGLAGVLAQVPIIGAWPGAGARLLAGTTQAAAAASAIAGIAALAVGSYPAEPAHARTGTPAPATATGASHPGQDMNAGAPGEEAGQPASDLPAATAPGIGPAPGGAPMPAPVPAPSHGAGTGPGAGASGTAPSAGPSPAPPTDASTVPDTGAVLAGMAEAASGLLGGTVAAVQEIVSQVQDAAPAGAGAAVDAAIHAAGEISGAAGGVAAAPAVADVAGAAPEPVGDALGEILGLP